jgi:hypothetical protein
MVIVRSTGWIMPVVAALTLAGCVTTSGSLSSSAQRLERNASELHADAREDRARTSYTRDAQDLAEEARDFRRVVEDRSARDGDVEEAFAELSRRYHALRDEMDRAPSREAQVEFKAVTDAYLDVEREMRRHGHKDRYARDARD